MDLYKTNVSTWLTSIGISNTRTRLDDPPTLMPSAIMKSSSVLSNSSDPVPIQTPDTSDTQTCSNIHDPFDQFANPSSTATPSNTQMTVLEHLQSLINTSAIVWSWEGSSTQDAGVSSSPANMPSTLSYFTPNYIMPCFTPPPLNEHSRTPTTLCGSNICTTTLTHSEPSQMSDATPSTCHRQIVSLLCTCSHIQSRAGHMLRIWCLPSVVKVVDRKASTVTIASMYSIITFECMVKICIEWLPCPSD